MNPPSDQLQVVIDASIVIAVCSNEPDKFTLADTALRQYAATGCTLHAPQLVVMEALYVLCRKLEAGSLTADEHTVAITNLQTLMATILPPVGGDIALAARAEQLRQGYGCRHSADSVYIALAEELVSQGPTELLTFDAGQQKHAARMAPAVTVNLLVP